MISPKLAAVLRMLDSPQGDGVAALGKAQMLLPREKLSFGEIASILEQIGKNDLDPTEWESKVRRYSEAARAERERAEAEERERTRAKAEERMAKAEERMAKAAKFSFRKLGPRRRAARFFI